jgi:NAD(P)-dependent dehydrogenase (short-subunit alcohol dehydrogenase family)
MNATAQKKIVANKVLVTGASGLLGVAAIEKFLSAGWEVVGGPDCRARARGGGRAWDGGGRIEAVPSSVTFELAPRG